MEFSLCPSLCNWIVVIARRMRAGAVSRALVVFAAELIVLPLNLITTC